MIQRPTVSPLDTIAELLKRSGRQAVPIRRTFLQQPPGPPGTPRDGPLAKFVRNHDGRALDFYLLILSAISSDYRTGEYDVAHHAVVWARALSLETPNATTAVSRTLGRLADYKLVARRRDKRQARITLLREDGSGAPYTHPGATPAREPYLQLPHEYWLAGWHQSLTLPEKAVLLIALSQRDGFPLPSERGKEWYGLSPDTIQKGLRELRQHGLLEERPFYKPAPLTPEGYTKEYHYALRDPFRSRRHGPRTTASPEPTADPDPLSAGHSIPRAPAVATGGVVGA